jgi:hypothetical protein
MTGNSYYGSYYYRLVATKFNTQLYIGYVHNLTSCKYI